MDEIVEPESRLSSIREQCCDILAKYENSTDEEYGFDALLDDVIAKAASIREAECQREARIREEAAYQQGWESAERRKDAEYQKRLDVMQSACKAICDSITANTEESMRRFRELKEVRDLAEPKPELSADSATIPHFECLRTAGYTEPSGSRRNA